MITTSDASHLQKWVGNTVESEAVILAETANLMAVTLDREPDFQAEDALPPAWHWLYFPEVTKSSQLGLEGHSKVGGFMPPVPLPRRMWAGGSFKFGRPLRLGERASKRSMVKSVTPKEGRTGKLCFVIVEHEISVAGDLRFTEEQTIVYREAPRPDQPAVQAKPAPTKADLSASYTPDPIQLFRYSALTFNGHRIHYDVDYCREVEGYPDLVVHGPLIATLLLDLFYRQYPAEQIASFAYQARSPLFNPHPFTVNGSRVGDTAEAWAANKDGGLAMKATVEFVGVV